jgi:hypothetical protein
MGLPGVMEVLILLALCGLVVVPVVLVVFFVVRRSGDSQGGNPNLRPCPDCGAPISLRATACPRCGAPLGGGPPDKGAV